MHFLSIIRHIGKAVAHVLRFCCYIYLKRNKQDFRIALNIAADETVALVVVVIVDCLVAVVVDFVYKGPVCISQIYCYISYIFKFDILQCIGDTVCEVEVVKMNLRSYIRYTPFYICHSHRRI